MNDLSFIKGIVPPILTPIDKNELIDEAKLRAQVDFVIEGGVHGILAFGSNGEFYMVEDDEYERGLKIILDQAKGRVPVYLGVGAISTKKCIRLAQMGLEAGAQAVSLLPPMFISPNETELYTHLVAVAKSVPDLPVLLYNNPGRTHYGLSQDLIYKLCHEVENIVGMKDSSGDMTQTAEFIRRNRDVNFKVLGGKDTLVYGALLHGAVGAVCTTANFVPKLVTNIYEKVQKGDLGGALQDQFLLNPIRLGMDKASFPVGTKDMANLAGRNAGDPYLPNFSTSKPELLAGMKAQLAANPYD
ncbi:MAG: dihydrodipicolinate synthase family protein [Sphaerochaeta sp.]|jgi:4-hydroxy-tetrahydrodipicolinate synthase|uniref:dihydrodipicolinate synthase family protein n=1 Tax=Sphaerochaeta sp. TaxID=1972642 RepID=UPI002971E5EC|nr:dihydrodipicolinate synthase family protein [uncultured Sphaerochaeta sp.]MDD3059064.1 dihydrodipicolinate synthase family protein [Sphaerochaeta sp.]MDD3930321.1 dihydrodipicolinate synthase family protein [Sphaerochaeta sp.]